MNISQTRMPALLPNMLRSLAGGGAAALVASAVLAAPPSPANTTNPKAPQRPAIAPRVEPRHEVRPESVRQEAVRQDNAKPRQVTPVPTAPPQPRPREVAPPVVTKPDATKPTPTPRPPQPVTKPREPVAVPGKPIEVTKPVDPIKPRDPVKPRDTIKPRDPVGNPVGVPGKRPIDGDSPTDLPTQTKPTTIDPRGDDRGVGRPRDGRGTNPPLKTPVDHGASSTRPRDERPIEERPSIGKPGVGKPIPRPTNSAGVPPRKPQPIADVADTRGHFTSDHAFGVPVARPVEGRRGGGDRDDDGHAGYNRYATNIARCNGWGFGRRWSDCGPCHTWQGYDCHDGARIAFGFGSGFSFGFYYGTSCAPLCSSWCNPWWEGYACSWNCSPYRWNYWACRPWWSGYYGCGPCPIPAWTPCYTYAGWCAPVVYQPVVYAEPVVVVQQPAAPNPDAMWAFLADGYDRDAEDGFILLEAAYPADARWEIGQGFARALRSDTARAADLLRHAFANDPTAIMRLSGDPKFIARLEALERSLAPAANAARPSTDALVVMAASQAARGALQDAYLNATTAESEGDRSAGTGAFVSWLRAELRRAP